MAYPMRCNVRPWSPTPEQAAFLQSIEPTRNFLYNLPDSALRQYAGQWIAARDSKIIAAAPTRAKLHDLLGDRNDPHIIKMRLATRVYSKQLR